MELTFGELPDQWSPELYSVTGFGNAAAFAVSALTQDKKQYRLVWTRFQYVPWSGNVVQPMLRKLPFGYF